MVNVEAGCVYVERTVGMVERIPVGNGCSVVEWIDIWILSCGWMR